MMMMIGYAMNEFRMGFALPGVCRPRLKSTATIRSAADLSFADIGRTWDYQAPHSRGKFALHKLHPERGWLGKHKKYVDALQ